MFSHGTIERRQANYSRLGSFKTNEKCLQGAVLVFDSVLRIEARVGGVRLTEHFGVDVRAGSELNNFQMDAMLLLRHPRRPAATLRLHC